MKVASSLVLVLSLHAALASQGLAPATAWRQFESGNGPGWTVQWNPSTGTPSAIYGPGLKLGRDIGSLAVARGESAALLNRFAALLGRGQSNFVETIGVKANQVYIFVYEQDYKGLPVISGRADVRIHEVGTVAMFGSSAVHIPNGFNMKPTITAEQARALGQKHVLGTKSLIERAAPPQLVVWANTESKARTTATLAFEVQIDERPGKPVVGKAYVNAGNGAILEFKNEVYECGSCVKKHVASSRTDRHANRMQRAMAKVPALNTPAPRESMAPLTGKVMAWTNLGILPVSPMTNTPLANIQVTRSAGSAYTDANGNFSIPYSGSSAVTVNATLVGRHSLRIRVASGTQMSASA
ncbi:MAG: hypothetical protein VX951_03750, partial [Planctomycetota bacterium]|nr:hypothetical protein [Planctomycetota bacterium]